ncbi:hypothetical protein PAECIP111892_05195 [Paenibacillus auburnensis]|uniref:SLH domain-containing protein n=2 Tax=Paenibacillus auburnensis TaxID=2905649 RepID=A0ABM9CU53_9BACL|nr:hypothetical protein PAECIP111892_05195 [Paenibacillus auburnensis]
MKLRMLSMTLIVALCISLVPAAVFAASAAVTLNPVASVETGGTVVITGTSTLDEVIIQVLRPVKSTVFYDIVQVSGGKFSSSFTLGKAEAAGTYKVTAGQANQVATADLIVKTAATGTGSGDGNGAGNGGGTGSGGGTDTGGETGGGTDTGSGTGSGTGNGTGTVTAGSGSVATGTITTPGTPITPPATNAVPVKVDTGKNTAVTAVSAKGVITATVTQDAAALAEALTAAAKQDNHGAAPIVFIAYNNHAGEGVQFKLPASVLAAAALNAPNTIISLQTNDGEYSLPLSVLNFAAVAQSLSTATADLSIQVNISPAASDLNSKIQRNAQGIAASQTGAAIEFSVTASGNGTTIELNHFGSTYLERSMVITAPVDKNRATVVLYDDSTGQFSFVPAVFNKQANGSTKVTFKRNGNSIYTVLTASRTFGDISKHWARADIELLASKLIVNGSTASEFAPDSSITRAEFAALLVRSLGLTPVAAPAAFTDVKEGDWYAGSIGAAVQAKLVEGFQDNSFRPSETITREQMAVMISRAIGAAGKANSAAGNPNVLLAGFSDKTSIGSWAQAAVAQAVEAKIITGMTSATFVPSAKASRAQAAVMLTRLLQYTGFVN